jgi:hypothetical protein
VVAVGASLTVHVDGARVFAVTDSSLAQGRFGLYTARSSTTAFDSVTAAVRTDDYFTLAVIPDTQHETQYAPAMFTAQTRWLAEHRAELHLVAVLHEGDVVNDRPDAAQWRTAAAALRLLAGKVPYVVAAGNHDLEDRFAPRPLVYDKAPFNALIAGLPGAAVSGRHASGDYTNTYYLFEAAGVPLVVINLINGPTDPVLRWAGAVADAYPDRRAVLLTHDYLGVDGRRRTIGDRHLSTDNDPRRNNGADIWTEFVAGHPNVALVLNGHVIDPVSPTEPWSAARLTSLNDAGRPVHQLLANYQAYGRGNGYLRLLRFHPAAGTLAVSTYSPYLGRYLTDERNEFTLTGVLTR